MKILTLTILGIAILTLGVGAILTFVIDKDAISPERRQPSPTTKEMASAQRAIAERNAENARINNLINAGRVGIGMTPNEVRAAIGKPTRVNASTSRYGTREQWVYDPPAVMHQPLEYVDYVYFEDDVCSSFSTKSNHR